MKSLLIILAALSSFSFSGNNKAEGAVFDVTCSSYNYSQTCDIPNFRRATLIRQLSYAPCISTKTFLFDRVGIHVWNGCSAVFRVETTDYYGPQYPPHGGYDRPHRPRPPVYGPGHPHQGPRYGDGGRDGRGPRYGNGGRDDRGGRDGYGRGPNNGRTETISINCDSIDRNHNFCHVRGQVIDAWVTKKKSDASCARGRGYTVSHNGITVKNGCRAKFKVSVRH